MKIRYQRDEDKSYDPLIKSMLKAHNNQFHPKDDYQSITLYAVKNQKLIGAIEANLFWNWGSINRVFYDHKETLMHLLCALDEAVLDNVVGISLTTTVTTRLNDFLQSGFILDASVPLSDNETYYYAHMGELSCIKEKDASIKIVKEADQAYEHLFDLEDRTFNKKNQIFDASESYDVVAIEENVCIGGLQSAVYGNMLYISRLIVNPEYRNQSIGSSLVNMAIQFAKNNHLAVIMLGTTDFQAKDFYEKIGFKVMHTRENQPPGYHSYAMFKWL